MSLAEDATPCTVCGEPVLWGTRHPICGQRVMAAEALDLDQLKRIVRAKEAALGVMEAPEPKPQPGDRERIDAALRNIWAAFDDWTEQEQGLARTVWLHAEQATRGVGATHHQGPAPSDADASKDRP